MYEEFYGFKFKPFDLLPDPRFLYMSPQHDLALTHLEYGITDNKGFIVLTGDVGTGKTTLINYFLRKANKDVNTALIYNTAIEPITFLEMVVKDFGIKPPDSRQSTLYDSLYRFLLSEHVQGRRSVLIIDETQNMPKRTLEEVRMLSNFETEESYLLQIIMAGQPQLRTRLKDPELSQLTQRISVYYHLAPLEKEEVTTYIEHRLKVAGYDISKPLFTKNAIQQIYAYSGGVPRIVSSICDTALVYAYGDETRTIDTDIIERVIQDRDINPGIAPGNGEKKSLSDSSSNIEISKIDECLSSFERRLAALEKSDGDRAISKLTEMLKAAQEENNLLQKKYHVLLHRYKMISDSDNRPDDPRKRIVSVPSINAGK